MVLTVLGVEFANGVRGQTFFVCGSGGGGGEQVAVLHSKFVHGGRGPVQVDRGLLFRWGRRVLLWTGWTDEVARSLPRESFRGPCPIKVITCFLL